MFCCVHSLQLATPPGCKSTTYRTGTLYTHVYRSQYQYRRTVCASTKTYQYETINVPEPGTGCTSVALPQALYESSNFVAHAAVTNAASGGACAFFSK